MGCKNSLNEGYNPSEKMKKINVRIWKNEVLLWDFVCFSDEAFCESTLALEKYVVTPRIEHRPNTTCTPATSAACIVASGIEVTHILSCNNTLFEYLHFSGTAIVIVYKILTWLGGLNCVVGHWHKTRTVSRSFVVKDLYQSVSMWVRESLCRRRIGVCVTNLEKHLIL